MAADGTIFVEIDPTGAVVGAKRVKKELDGVGNSADRTGKKTGRLKTGLAEVSRGLIGPLGLAAAAAAAALALKKTIDVAAKFQQSVAELSAITGATGKDLTFLSDQAKLLGRTTTLSASQVATGFKLIASAKPDLLESGEALTEVTKQAITLAEAAGITLPDAAVALAGSLNQFQAEADEAGRFINVLAAGSKRGAAEIPELTASLKAAGTVAASAGLSFEETIANIETLAEVNLKAEESGTALRNIILLLQKQGVDKLNPAVVGLTQALENLNEEERTDVELLKIFGVRNFAAVKALLSRTEKTKKLQAAITGTLTAEEQALINTDTLEGKTKALNSAIEGLAIAIGETLVPSIEDSVSFFATYINVITDAFNATKSFISGLDNSQTALEELADADVETIEKRIGEENQILNDLLDANADALLIVDDIASLGVTKALRQEAIAEKELEIAQLKSLRDKAAEAAEGEGGTSGKTPGELAAEAEIAAQVKLAEAQKKAAEEAKKRQEEAAKNAIRAAEEQQRSFASLADSLNPLEASLKELNEAEAVLQQQRALGLITADEEIVLQGQLTDKFREALDPVGALNERLAEEAMLAGLSTEAKAIEVRVQSELNALKAAGVEDVEALRDGIKGEVEEIARLNALQNVQVETTKEVNKELELQKSILEEIRGPQEEMNNRIAALKALLDGGKIELEEFTAQLRMLNEQMLEGQTDAASGFERGFIKAQAKLNDFASISEKIVVDSFQGMEDTVVNFVKTGKVEIGSLVDSILEDFIRLAARQALAGALGSSDGEGGGSGILGLVGGLFSKSAGPGGPPGLGGGGGGGQATSGSGSSFANLASLAGSLFTTNQDGGIERQPVISTLAEKGPEAVIPLKGGKVPVEIAGATKPPINVNNTFIVSTPDPGQFGRSAGQVGNLMGTAMQSALARNS